MIALNDLSEDSLPSELPGSQLSKSTLTTCSNDEAWYASTSLKVDLENVDCVAHITMGLKFTKTMNSIKKTKKMNFNKDLTLSITLIPTCEQHVINKHSNSIPANGLCGYLAYYVYVQICRDSNQLQQLCPDLNISEELLMFKTFFENIDEGRFTGSSQDIEGKRFRHCSLLNLLQRLVEGKLTYKCNISLLSQQEWCTSELMQDYDIQCTKQLRILAVKNNNLNQYNLNFYCNTWTRYTFTRLAKEHFLQIQQPTYMIVWENQHFYLAPNYLNGSDTLTIFESYVNLLQQRIEFYKETSI